VPSPKKKVTLYFSAGMLDETQHEAIRQDRSISWIIQAAWRIAREEVQRLPATAGRRRGAGRGIDVRRQQETGRVAVVAVRRLIPDLDVVTHGAVQGHAREASVGGGGRDDAALRLLVVDVVGREGGVDRREAVRRSRPSFGRPPRRRRART
jgi:uncharacterized small protein (TIGR04563 family)